MNALKELFNGENGFWVGLSRLGALIVLNLLTVVCCLPVVTGGASFAAAAKVTARMAEDRESGIVTREFIRAFKASFKQATIVWLVILAVFGVLAGDAYYALTGSGALADFFWVFAIAGLTVAGLTLMWLFPLIALYDAPVKTHVTNAFKLALSCLPRSLLLLALRLIPLVLCLVSYKALILITPLYMLVGVSATGFVSAKLRAPVFEQLSRREKMLYGNGNA